MNNRVLLVDDEPNLLQGFRRSLRGKYDLVLAEGGAAAIEQLSTNGPFALVISDMQMPEIDGLKVLSTARSLTPDTVRVMLTGNVDQQTAVDAVNDGSIFRFLNKPCPVEMLSGVIDDGLAHYQLITAERELLSKTLSGCIGLINELLSIASPKAFGRGGRLRQWTRLICAKLQLKDAWQNEIAAMLSQVGSIMCTSTGNATIGDLDVEIGHLRQQAEASSALIAKIPRLDMIAAMIRGQYPSNPPDQLPENIERGARMLRMLIEYDVLIQNRSPAQSIRYLQEFNTPYDEAAVEAFAEIVLGAQERRSLSVTELLEGMILENDVLTGNGEVLLRSGHELTDTMIHRMRSFIRNSVGVRQPIVVRVRKGILGAQQPLEPLVHSGG
ncbi:MAG: response regulator [Pirellula sp.]|jgi:CheY-like chemotaxis protein|nr:response regulator [Pirellula sp.]